MSAAEAARLADIRAAHAAIAPGLWSRAVDADGEFVEARGEMGELIELCRFHVGSTAAERSFVADAPGAIGFLLGLVDRAISAARARAASAGPAETARRPGKDYAAEAAIKCAEPAFKRFLIDMHGLESPATDERCAQKLRSLCGVTSRREFNDGGGAAARWDRLRRDFDQWRKRG